MHPDDVSLRVWAGGSANPASDGYWAHRKSRTYQAHLCYGWVDSQKQAYDCNYYLQKFTPRGSKSVWPKINVTKVAALSKEGKIRLAELAAIESAKQDGRWNAAYDLPGASEMLKIDKVHIRAKAGCTNFSCDSTHSGPQNHKHRDHTLWSFFCDCNHCYFPNANFIY